RTCLRPPAPPPHATHVPPRRSPDLSVSESPPICMCRWMFSTTTIASSTRMPIEKMSAKSDTRFSVNPQAHDANNVAASVTTTARSEEHTSELQSRENFVCRRLLEDK